MATEKCGYIARRADQTYEIGMPGTGMPYHVTQDDDWYPVLLAECADLAPGTALVLQEGDEYTLMEDHRGASGWVNGEAFTVEVFGPLPEGWSSAPPPDVQQAAMPAAFTNAIQQHLDGFAQTRNYDGILSAATYATSTVPKFAAEGQYAVEARDSTWAGAYAILDAVLVGVRPMPSIEEVIAELPVLAWPEV